LIYILYVVSNSAAGINALGNGVLANTKPLILAYTFNVSKKTVNVSPFAILEE